MFREMRRGRQALPEEMCEAVLSRGSHGVLALAGDEGYPYAVPISYVYEGGKLYFHCARSGHKLDAIARCPKASFCVVDQDQVVPQEYTTYFRSVIVFGTIRVLTDDGEKRRAIEALAVKYAPEDSPIPDCDEGLQPYVPDDRGVFRQAGGVGDIRGHAPKGTQDHGG